MATILEALQNAKHNLTSKGAHAIQQMLGQQQLYNAVTLLEKGYDLEEEVEDLIVEHGSVDDVPRKDKSELFSG